MPEISCRVGSDALEINGEDARAQEGARCEDMNHLGLLRGPYAAY